MKSKSNLVALLVTFAAASTVNAISFTQRTDIKSALKDANGFFSTSSEFHGQFEHSAADPDFFVNSIMLTTGAGWDSNLDIGAAMDFGDVPFGQAITGDVNFGFEVANRYGEVNPAVPTGIYEFTIDILGGLNSTEMENFAHWTYRIDVRENLLMDVTGSFAEAQVGPGQTAHLNMTVTNTGAAPIRTDTWFLANNVGSASNSMLWAWNTDPGWWGVTLNPGQTETRPHSDYMPNATTPTGSYFQVGGVVGGFYVEDWHWKPFAQTPTFEVVPEPASLLSFCVGATVLLIRRRRRQR